MNLVREIVKGGKGLWNYMAAGGTIQEVSDAENILKIKTDEIANAIRRTPANVQLALVMESRFGAQQGINTWGELSSALLKMCQKAGERIAPADSLLEGESDGFDMVRTHVENLAAWIDRMNPNLRDFLDYLKSPRPEKMLESIMPTEVSFQASSLDDIKNLRLPTRTP